MVVIQHSEILGGKGAIVTVEGPLNGNAAVDLDEYVTGLMNNGIRAVLIDAGRIEYISSAGIGAFLMIHKKLRSEEGSLAVFSMNEETATIFRLLGFDREIIVAADKNGAMKATPVPGDAPKKVHVDSPQAIPVAIDEPDGMPSGAASPGLEAAESFPDERATVAFENPIVVECRKCGALVRVRRSGDYACPECDAEFTVKNDMSIAY